MVLRYGENPHQQAALYARPECRGASVVAARQLHGKELSYNNLLDLDSALAIVRQFAEPAAVVIKHNNPCGAAVAGALAAALQRAMAGDPLSAFGSVLGLNRPMDAATAEVLGRAGPVRRGHRRSRISTTRALEILTTRPKWKANVRLLEVGDFDRLAAALDLPLPRRRRADAGGRRAGRPGGSVAGRHRTPSPPTRKWPTCASPGTWSGTSNRTPSCLCKDRMLLGTGAGQMSRVDSVEIAIKKAGRPCGRLGAGLRRLLPLPRLDRDGRRRRRGRRHPARRLEERRPRRSPPATGTASR